MIGMKTVGERFSTPFTTLTGIPVMGSLQVHQDQKIYDDNFLIPRQLLRTNPLAMVSAGDILVDPLGRHFLLGSLAEGLMAFDHNYTIYQVYLCTGQVLWEREQSEVDALTGLEKGIGKVLLGNIWVLNETLSKEMRNPKIPARESVKRVVTGEAVQVGDTINGMKVSKVIRTLGLHVLEMV